MGKFQPKKRIGHTSNRIVFIMVSWWIHFDNLVCFCIRCHRWHLSADNLFHKTLDVAFSHGTNFATDACLDGFEMQSIRWVRQRLHLVLVHANKFRICFGNKKKTKIKRQPAQTHKNKSIIRPTTKKMHAKKDSTPVFDVWTGRPLKKCKQTEN